MKKTLLLLIMGSVTFYCFAQTSGWTLLTSGTTTNLLGVSAPSTNVCYVSGISGKIMKTINGGGTWISQTSGTNQHLYSINFVDDNTGFAVGDNGTAIKTTNGGTTWSQMAVGTSTSFRCVYFLNSSIGFITGGESGNSGLILKTSNGGISWTSTITPTNSLYGISFSSATDGYTCDWDGIIVKTSNGGNSWTSSSNGYLGVFSGIKFINPTTGFLVGRNGKIRQTTNAGATWTDVFSGTTDGLGAINFVDSNNGFITGGNIPSNTGTILSTTNSGASWSIYNPGTPFLYSVSFADANTGYIVGNIGTILKYVPPIDARFTASQPGCTGQFENFSSLISGATGVTHSWDFGLGANPAASALENPTGIMYATPGAKSVTHIVTDGIHSDTVINLITINSSPIASFTSTAPVCNSSPIDFINTGSSGAGFTYSWDFSADATPATSTIQNPSGILYNNSGTKTVSFFVSNQFGCVTSVALPIIINSFSQNASWTLLINSTNVSCFNGNDGSATISLFGGTGTFNYLWSPVGGTTASATGLSAGTYTCTISDTNNCTNKEIVTITEPEAPIVPAICMVTVDSLSINNEIYWDETLPEYSSVDSFIVYRYDIISSSYLRIGAVSKNSLGLFTDTARGISGPNGGDPQYSGYQYKLAIRDTCGNLSGLSPYHQSMFIQQNNQNFSWNPYTIEGASSVNGYQFLRDDNGTGLWHALVNTTGLATIDPNYSIYPNGKWRAQALGLNCTPKYSSISPTRSNIKYANITTGIANDKNETIKIYPNPATESITIELPGTIDARTIKIMNVLGEIVFNETISSKAKTKTLKNINVSSLPKGIYSVIIGTNNQNILKKLVIQ